MRDLSEDERQELAATVHDGAMMAAAVAFDAAYGEIVGVSVNMLPVIQGLLSAAVTLAVTCDKRRPESEVRAMLNAEVDAILPQALFNSRNGAPAGEG